MAASNPHFCVIGAGPCGLTAAKNLLQLGFTCDVLERQRDLGGNWNIATPHSSAYQSTHLISSKQLTEFTDFPMPADFPFYPSHRQVLDYLRSYAARFEIEPRIQYGAEVASITPQQEGWLVQVVGEAQARSYHGVFIANGHHSDPLYPSFPGTFAGEILHAHQYKKVEQLHDRRVLVVGAGNSGCDIAAEAGNHAAATFLSLRRGYHFLPKFVRGLPIDMRGENLHRWGLPLWLRRWIGELTIRLTTGTPEMYGLPKPDHRLFETHPIVNSQLLYQLGHGRIQVKPNIARLDGNEIEFVDGTRERIDLLIYATGYRIGFPFLDSSWVFASPHELRLFLNVFHPERDDLFFIGLIQPDSGIWGLADLQCQLATRYLRLRADDPERATNFRQRKLTGRASLSDGIRYVASPRHVLEVEYYSYRERLKKLIGQIARVAASR